MESFTKFPLQNTFHNVGSHFSHHFLLPMDILGADPMIANENGHTPMQYAKGQAIKQLLEENGKKVSTVGQRSDD